MKKNIDLKIFICFITCFIVFIFYAHTLNYSWKYSDDIIIFRETILPIPRSFSEIFEYLTLFGLNHHFEASNPFYSSILNLRSDPFNFFITLFVLFFFQKNAFLYHLLSLILHIFNTCLLFFILDKISSNYNFTTSNKIRFILISLLTLFWALNPLNIESILLASHWPAMLTYFLCLLIFYLSIKQDCIKIGTLSQPVIIFVLFLISLLTCEYSITLPIIIFCYIFLFKKSVQASIKEVKPLLFAAIPFLFYFLTSQTINNLILNNNIQLFLERILWLSPQIFFHSLKLILFPFHLSIDQTAFVRISGSLFEPYSIFCSIFMYSILLITLFSLFNIKSPFAYLFFILFAPFFVALLPFLHIFSPIYSLSSERYLYFPLLFLILGISNILFFFLAKLTSTNLPIYSIIAFILIVTFSYSYKTYIRTLDWKDSFTLLKSTIGSAPNGLFKAFRQKMLASSTKLFYEASSVTCHFDNKQALSSVKKAFRKLKKQVESSRTNPPQIIRFYGLDSQTLLAKFAFLVAFSDYDVNNDPENAYKIFSPYVKNLKVLDTQILTFYYNILIQTNRIDEANTLLLQNLQQNRISPALYVALSDFTEYNYKDLKQAEKYLLLSNKYFPYEPGTLLGLQRLYRSQNNTEKFAFYSYLYGLRTHNITSLKDAASTYLRVGNKEKSKIILNKLLQYYPVDNQILRIKMSYEQRFGGIK